MSTPSTSIRPAKLPLDHPGDETLEAEGQGGFPGFAGAQDSQALAGAHHQIQPVKDRPGGLFIAEIEVGDLDDGIDWLQKLPVIEW